MTRLEPPNAEQVRSIVSEHLAAYDKEQGYKDTVTVEWRGVQRALPVITMRVDLLSYNPSTHRVRAQRTLDPTRDGLLDSDPFGEASQAYLHELLMGDPSDPAKTDPEFTVLKDDLAEHGQRDPGIIRNDGVLINGNTRCCALRESGAKYIRVGVLPDDTGVEDMEQIELVLQLRRDHKRDYSFVNTLLALDEMVENGASPADAQREFRIRPKTFEQYRWVLSLIKEAISRSQAFGTKGEGGLRLVDFETHQGKLEELFRTYSTLKKKSPDEAELLREQRLMALVLGKSKTDLRLIEPTFFDAYLSKRLPEHVRDSLSRAEPVLPPKIPGTSVQAHAPSFKVEQLRSLTDTVLRLKAAASPDGPSTSAEKVEATNALAKLSNAFEDSLEVAGKNARVRKRQFAASERLADANEALAFCATSVAESRATSNFNPDDLDEGLIELRKTLLRLAQTVARDPVELSGDGLSWLISIAKQDG